MTGDPDGVERRLAADVTVVMSQIQAPTNLLEIAEGARIARLALTAGFVTRSVFDDFDAPAGEDLGNLLVERGFVSAAQLAQLRRTDAFLVFRELDRQHADAICGGSSDTKRLEEARSAQLLAFQKRRAAFSVLAILRKLDALPETAEAVSEEAGFDAFRKRDAQAAAEAIAAGMATRAQAALALTAQQRAFRDRHELIPVREILERLVAVANAREEAAKAVTPSAPPSKDEATVPTEAAAVPVEAAAVQIEDATPSSEDGATPSNDSSAAFDDADESLDDEAGSFDDEAGSFDDAGGQFDDVGEAFDDLNGPFDEDNEPFGDLSGPLDDASGSEASNLHFTFGLEGLVTTVTGSAESPEELVECARERGVVFGLASREAIEAWIEDGCADSFAIARGEAPKPPVDERVEYDFDPDPLGIGAASEDGRIDFSDRGVIPCVAADAVIAIRIPGSPGEPGTNVFGLPIEPRAPRKALFQKGKNVTIEEDGHTMRAAKPGEPICLPDGRISVLNAHAIPGDVGLETGHVTFDGTVNIAGTVQSGFNVTAETVSAGEIMRSVVTSGGDVVVTGGLLGATIKAQGNLRARYLRDCFVEVQGDVVIQTEIVGSTVVCTGVVKSPNGRLLDSEIWARKGIDVKNVGSDATGPCKLVAGIDRLGEARRVGCRQVIEEAGAAVDVARENVVRLEEASKGVAWQIAELAQVADRITMEMREHPEETKRLAGRARMTEKRLDMLFDEQEKADDAVEEAAQQVRACEKALNEACDALAVVEAWLVDEASNARVRIRGSIYEKTSIRGVHAEIVMQHSVRRVMVAEAFREGRGHEMVVRAGK